MKVIFYLCVHVYFGVMKLVCLIRGHNWHETTYPSNSLQAQLGKGKEYHAKHCPRCESFKDWYE